MPELNDTQNNRAMFPLRKGMLLDPNASAEAPTTEQVTETPVFATEAPTELEVTQPEVSDAPEVTIDDFRGQRPVMTDVPVEKEVTNLDEVQPEVKPVEEEPQAQPTEPTIWDAYPAAKALQKKMANDARQFLEARLSELEATKKQKLEIENSLALAKQGRTQVPDSYYENAHAYVLLPEYQSAQANSALAQKIVQHWYEQKERVASGMDWYDIQEVRDAQGRLVDIKPAADAIKLDGKGVAAVDTQYMHSAQQFNELRNQAQHIAQNFRQNVNSRIEAIRKAENEIFANDNWAKKDTAEYKTAEQVADGIKKLGISESNPAFGLLKKTGAAYLMLREAYVALEKKQTQAASVQQKQRAAGPTTSSLKSGGGGVAPQEVSIDDFRGLLHNR